MNAILYLHKHLKLRLLHLALVCGLGHICLTPPPFVYFHCIPISLCGSFGRQSLSIHSPQYADLLYLHLIGDLVDLLCRLQNHDPNESKYDRAPAKSVNPQVAC